MNKDLKSLDNNSLKVEAYDTFATIEELQRYLKEINNELSLRFQNKNTEALVTENAIETKGISEKTVQQA